ncbi:hypothetical protein BJY04DRAFT_202345 [Aspergillus karnatakaensis]|uniref:uncharacterized protein n=1 Tax=Aspergillus karnatakaensis TaxID=1810916 RepID=UPI003CCCC251
MAPPLADFQTPCFPALEIRTQMQFQFQQWLPMAEILQQQKKYQGLRSRLVPRL